MDLIYFWKRHYETIVHVIFTVLFSVLEEQFQKDIKKYFFWKETSVQVAAHEGKIKYH